VCYSRQWQSQCIFCSPTQILKPSITGQIPDCLIKVQPEATANPLHGSQASPSAQLHKSQHDGAGRMAPGSTGPTGTSNSSLLALGPLRNVGISHELNSNFRPVLQCRTFFCWILHFSYEKELIYAILLYSPIKFLCFKGNHKWISQIHMKKQRIQGKNGIPKGLIAGHHTTL
jgi:hypothetical protein